MAQSLTCLYAHLVFSTKHREPWFTVEIRSCVHTYLAGIIRELESPWVVVGGVADHVHLLFEMSKMTAPATIVGTVKRESSKFIKTLGNQYAKFYWQRGCGMFSVSPKDIRQATRYVHNQEEHHRTLSFQEEYRAMLNRYGIKFNEAYVWD